MTRSRFKTALSGACLLAWLVATTAAFADKGKDPIVVTDAHYGEVLFYFYQEDYFPAIVRLLAALEAQQVDQHLTDAELLLGGMYLSYGHHLEAAGIFERLLADNADPEIRDRTWFFLAKIWKQRGYLAEAEEALGRIEGELPGNLRRESEMLRAQILIDKGDYDAAIALLENWKGKTEWASYARFNLGVALVRSGRVDDARKILDDLGDMNPYSEELMSLQDKANLALGYALLQEGESKAARPVLQRIRLEGPFSNKALLGVGWADAERGSFERALVPWMELRRRDLLDPAVQESMLAIPYAMAELDAMNQAADHYLNAVEAFYEEGNRIDAAIDRIESGELFDGFLENDPGDSAGWYWELQSLPDGPDGRYLFHLLSTHEFQEGLKNYRDLDYMYRNLEHWQQSIDVFRGMLDTRRQAYDERLPRVEDALVRADVDSLIGRKLEFDAVLNEIERSNDWLALATEAEFEMWGEITGLEATPALQSGIPEAEEVRDKIALLKGVLQWELEKAFKDRLWRIRRDVRETGEALVETQRSRRQIDESMRRQPLEFAAYETRIANLSPQIEGMQMRVEDAMSAQRAYLRNIAVGELRAQRQRLDIYTVQARFALATIYDTAATVSEVAD